MPVLTENEHLRADVVALVDCEPMPGKVAEGGARIECLKVILHDLVAGKIGLREAYDRTEQELPREGSVHAATIEFLLLVRQSGWFGHN